MQLLIKKAINLNFIRKQKNNLVIKYINMSKNNANNLPGYSLSNKLHYPVMWNRLYRNINVSLEKTTNNKYKLSLKTPEGHLLHHPSQYKYLKIKTKGIKKKSYHDIIFLIESLNIKTKAKQIATTSNVISNSTVGNINNVTTVNNVSNLLYPGRLVTYGPNGICVGCETYGLVNYVVVFPGTIPLYSEDDPFMIEGADLYFM